MHPLETASSWADVSAFFEKAGWRWDATLNGVWPPSERAGPIVSAKPFGALVPALQWRFLARYRQHLELKAMLSAHTGLQGGDTPQKLWAEGATDIKPSVPFEKVGAARVPVSFLDDCIKDGPCGRHGWTPEAFRESVRDGIADLERARLSGLFRPSGTSGHIDRM